MNPTRKPVKLHAAAEQDINDAIDYYLLEANDATAQRFVDALEGAFDHIARHPGSGSPRYADLLGLPGLRSWPLKRFPFLVFYTEPGDYIDVWRLLRQDRDIPAWMGEA